MNLGRDLSLDLRGDDVALLHRELAMIGLTAPDDERRQSLFGRGTHDLVARFQREHCLHPDGIVDGDTARAINVAVDATIYTVLGRVSSRLRAGVGGLRVQIVDKNVGRDVPLADATTDDQGRYCATFAITELRQSGKQRPDLQARIFASETFLDASRVSYNAANRETLNVVLTETAAPALPSEYETLTSALSGHFRGHLRDLKETDDRQDITYLAKKTGWDARAVALVALADQFSSRTIDRANSPLIEAPFFYALFRAGVPANEGALYRMGKKAATDIWKNASALGVISTTLEPRIAQVAEHFQELAVDRALDGSAPDGVSTLKDILTISLGDDPARHRRFAELYAEHRNDRKELWNAVRVELGEAAEKRLRLDGQLAYLTGNNAALMRKLHAVGARTGLTDIGSLAQQGYYRSEKWRDLIGDDAIPSNIPGDTNEDKRARYADVLAAHVRLSFPTMVVAQMVKEGETPVAAEWRDRVHAFLAEHQGDFDIGLQPVQRYIARNRLSVEKEVASEITRVQRVHQITPSDQAMNALLRSGIDSALAVSRFDREQFVRMYKDRVGGEANARITHAKAQQVHNVVLNLATSYLVARTAPEIGVHSPPKYVGAKPGLIQKAQQAVASNQVTTIIKYLDKFAGESADNAADVIPYATLESLFGEMDYCACEHCRSVLSPAAYLVDLLQFLDVDSGDENNPLEILLDRRPDIEHLPLSCENTNTALPYIDVVNETLEYYVTHDLSLTAYTGHSADGTVTSEELLATPQFVQDAAYEILAGEHQPNAAPPVLPPTTPLPFHQSLENLRRYFERFDTPLAEVMEALRTNDDLERPEPADPENPLEYGWRDILMEELRLSRAEHALLTDRSLTLQLLYGFAPNTSEDDVLFGISNPGAENEKAFGLSYAKAFARRMEISYDDIVEILKTRFVNPNVTVIPKLERLGVSFETLKAFKDGTIDANTLAEFEEIIAGLDASKYDGDVKAWVKDDANYQRIMGLITLTDPTGENDPCTFDKVEFRYTLPVDPADSDANRLRPFEFYRLIRFIRLWKKLGWTIEQTDKAITALYPEEQTPDSSDDAVNLQRLDAGFLTLLPRLGVVQRLLKALKLKAKKDLLPLLACFSTIETHGATSLYRQLFLYPAPSEEENPFADDGYGNLLTNNEKLFVHAEALRAAFQLTDDELSQITVALGFDDDTPLTLDGISAIFRRGWLARRLKLSVRELLLLIDVTGIDPFAPADPPHPPAWRFIDLVSRLRGGSLKPEQALYLIWNRDISGKSAPPSSEILELARTLRAAFAAIESEFVLTDDPNGQIARARMALVYGNDATNVFFGLLDNTLVSDITYDHHQATLEQSILDAAPGRVAYDDFGKLLSYGGVMTEAARDALKVGVPAEFEAAVDGLYGENQKLIGPFFDRYPELLPLYDAYVASQDAEDVKRSELLANFLPELKRRRKRQQALATVTATAKADMPFASAILDDGRALNPAAALAAPNADELPPAVEDFAAVERGGLSARFYSGATVGAPGVPADQESDAEANLAYSPSGGETLPFSPTSAIWTGYLEPPENGFYNFSIEPWEPSDPGPENATLALSGENKPLEMNGQVWTNATAIELRAGTLYPITIVAENITAGLKVRWQTQGRGWEVVPRTYLYPGTLTGQLHATYVRFLKAASLANGLKLTESEMAYFAAKEDYQIDDRGWLNSLPVVGTTNGPTSMELLARFEALLDFAALKAKLSPNNERLLEAIQDPTASLPAPEGTPDEERESLLLALTRWDGASLDALLLRFGKHLPDDVNQADRAALTDLGTFVRVNRAYAPVKKIGVSASALIAATTNEPRPAAVRAFKAALRARYEESDWLNVLRPINDEMRGLQRDALVAYILHQMRADPVSEHIDTPEKLFEYFLMDVQMDPCMESSRIRHALSSVQLFIERCFMNLETGVAPAVFEAKRKQWEWMKRYRVWEANRKVFLWPEHWLEALRTDHSPFFKEAMSELLQGDITEDRAATALLNYLSKLDEVAKLEPCGIHFLEGGAGTADAIAHVVARTAGANRKYFYRRYESGFWTPWELIKLDVEDNPVRPVVWKGRLFLFWLKILKEAVASEPDASDGATRVTVKAMLCWSEYYNGKWQPIKTSDVNRATELGQFDGAGTGAFDRSLMRLSVFENSDALCIEIKEEGGYLSLSEPFSFFVLHNTHSLPVPKEEPSSSDFSDSDPGPKRRDVSSGNVLGITYHETKFNEDILDVYTYTTAQQLLENKIGGETIEPLQVLEDPWTAPFFYGDSRHVFYVTTAKGRARVQQQDSYYDVVDTAKYGAIAPLIMQDYAVPGPGPYDFGPAGLDPSSMKRFVTEDAYVNKWLPITSTVRWDGADIGPAGRVMNTTQKP